MNLKQQITSTPEGFRAWHQELAIFETTNLMCEAMREAGVSRAELATRLCLDEEEVERILDGYDDLSLRVISDVFVAIGKQFRPTAGPFDPEEPT